MIELHSLHNNYHRDQITLQDNHQLRDVTVGVDTLAEHIIIDIIDSTRNLPLNVVKLLWRIKEFGHSSLKSLINTT